MMQSIIDGYFSDWWIFEELKPSVYALYNHTIEAYWISVAIAKTAEPLSNANTIDYVDSYSMVTKELNHKHIFFDNNYYNPYLYTSFIIDNPTNWNNLNANYDFYLDANNLWISLYPPNLNELRWICDDKTFFKFKLYGFHKSIYDINFLNERVFKHHDYQVDLYYCTSLFWNDHLLNQNHNRALGAFLFWYEPYGSVEILLKNFSGFWYQFWYPQIEEHYFLESVTSAGTWRDLLSDVHYANYLFPEYWDPSQYPEYAAPTAYRE